MRISLDRYGSKNRKVSRCRTTVSNETILATEQDIFFTKVAPVQNLADMLLLGFWLILPFRIFISSYTTIYFFAKNFFSNIYISVNTICESSNVFLLRNAVGHSLSMYGTRGMERGHSKCAQVHTVREASRLTTSRTHLHFFFSCFCPMVSCFICRNLTLSSFSKGAFVRNGYFSPMRSTSVVTK